MNMKTLLKYILVIVKVITVIIVLGFCLRWIIFFEFRYSTNSPLGVIFNELWITIEPFLFLLPTICLLDFFVGKKLRKTIVYTEFILITLAIVLSFGYVMLQWNVIFSLFAGFQNYRYERSSGSFAVQRPELVVSFYSPGKTFGEVKAIIERRFEKIGNTSNEISDVRNQRFYFSNVNYTFQDNYVLENDKVVYTNVNHPF